MDQGGWSRPGRGRWCWINLCLILEKERKYLYSASPRLMIFQSEENLIRKSSQYFSPSQIKSNVHCEEIYEAFILLLDSLWLCRYFSSFFIKMMLEPKKLEW